MASIRVLLKRRQDIRRLQYAFHTVCGSVADVAPPPSRFLPCLRSWQPVNLGCIAPWPQSQRPAGHVRCFASLPPHTELAMPSLSPTMSQGNIVAWHVKEGDEVAAGGLLADIETDKATLGWENMDDGFVAKILMPAGSKDIPVGTVVAVLVEESGSIPAFKDFSPSASSGARSAPSADPSPKETESTPSTSGGARHEPVSDRVGPAVQRLLRQNKIELSAVRPTGPHGIVTKGDVLAAIKGGAASGQRPKPPETQAPIAEPKQAAPAPPPAPAPSPPEKALPPSPPRTGESAGEPYTDIPNSQIRKVIASRLLESKQTVPHVYARGDVDLASVTMLRQSLKEQGVKVSVNDFIVKAVAMALVDVPGANARWDSKSGEIVSPPTIDVSIAVATDKGLITPIVKDANNKPLTQISEEVRQLAAKARANKLKPDEYQGGTFSISNLGMFGVDYFSAIINPPQACILAVGTTRNKVIMLDGQLSSVPQLTVTLSCDARVVDGDVAGHFLQALGTHMHNAAALLVQH